jgi:hypothetical protein
MSRPTGEPVDRHKDPARLQHGKDVAKSLRNIKDMLQRAAVKDEVEPVVEFLGQGLGQICQMLGTFIVREIHGLDLSETDLFQRQFRITRSVEDVFQRQILTPCSIQRLAIHAAMLML